MNGIHTAKTPIEVLLGHADQADEKRLITPAQGDVAEIWHAAYRAALAAAELTDETSGLILADAAASQERQEALAEAIESMAQEGQRWSDPAVSIDARMATAGCSRSDPAGCADTMMAVRLDKATARVKQMAKAAEAARAVNHKLGAGRAEWLASYMDRKWNPTNEAKRQRKRPQNIRIMLAEAVKEIAEFYLNYRK